MDYVDILVGVPPLGGLQSQYVGENDDFQPLHPKISRSSQTVSNAATINWKFAVDFFARGFHTRTAVARLPLRQLGFLVLLNIGAPTQRGTIRLALPRI